MLPLVLLAALACNRPLPAPERVELLTPADSAVLRQATIVFAWESDEPAGELVVGTDSQLKQLVLDTVVASGSCTLDVELDGRYYWRVRPQSTAGAWGDWSETRTLTVERFRLVTSVKTKGYPHDVWVHGTRAYVADGQAGLAVFDVAEPSSPVFVGSRMDSLNEAWGVVAGDDYAYVAYGYKELVVIDVRQTDSLALTGVLEYLQPGYGYDIALKDSTVFIAADAQFVKIDVANPAAPELVFQTYYPRDCRGVALWESNACVAIGQLGIACWEIDSQPPVQAGAMDTPGNARGIAVDNGYAFVADGREGLLVADVSDPGAPNAVGRLPLAGYALGVAVSGRFAYVACGDGGLSVVDVKSPAAPRLVAQVRTPHMVGVCAVGDWVFGGDRDLGLVVVKHEE
jgi:hypothetical protein